MRIFRESGHGRRSIATWSTATFLFTIAPGLTADPPRLLVLPIEMVDTSGEMPSGAKEHEDRLAALRWYLAHDLEANGLYAISDPAPISEAIDKARALQPLDKCHGCERDLARLVHADRVLVGEIHKVSSLIGGLRLNIIDVASGRNVFGRDLGFRGDTDEAWQHAVRFFVRDLEAVPAQQR